MRHGNIPCKPRPGNIYCIIPILPMRHGNGTTDITGKLRKLFRSYLWGMETKLVLKLFQFYIKFRSYLWGMETNEWGLWRICSKNRIPILPMRHGNQDSLHLQPQLEPIPILPMRHGNTVGDDRVRPTHRAFRSYLWGMETKFFPKYFFLRKFHSDPTYEAWKHFSWSRFSTTSYSIPILPMRHGNDF